MKTKWVIIGFLLFFDLGGRAYAGNDALAKPQTITAGERVAAYLQSLMISAGAILEAQKPGDLINSPEVYRVGITYDPQEKVIDISVVGNHGDLEIARKKLELTEKLVMSFNKKIQRNFGLSLGENDMVMDYLNAKAGKIILKYRDGKFELPSEPAAEKSSEAQPTPTVSATPVVQATPTP